jgi:glycosyltransferase involved in cell wall biosynthesis
MSKNSSKRIVIFSTAYYPFVGGAEISVKEITHRLGHGFEFDMITARLDASLPTTEVIDAITVHRVGWGIPLLDKLCLPFLGAKKLFDLHRDTSQSQFFCFWGIMVTFSTGAAYVYNICNAMLGRRRVPIVLTLQEGDSEDHLQFRWGGLLWLSWTCALKYAHFVTALSSFLLYRAERFNWRGPSAVIPNGVDIKLFTKKISQTMIHEMKMYLRKQENDIFLVTSSRLTYKNAVDDIISALTYLPANVKLIIIGKGEDGVKLKEQVKQQNLSQRVVFVGYVPHEDLPKYFSICDIFIRPSRSEGFGNSFIEAMASRLPVIATPVGGITDFIHDRETGVFCSPNNPKSIADSVEYILENKEVTQKMVDEAYTMVLSRFGWDDIAKRMKGEVFDTIQ